MQHANIDLIDSKEKSTRATLILRFYRKLMNSAKHLRDFSSRYIYFGNGPGDPDASDVRNKTKFNNYDKDSTMRITRIQIVETIIAYTKKKR